MAEEEAERWEAAICWLVACIEIKSKRDKRYISQQKESGYICVDVQVQRVKILPCLCSNHALSLLI